MDASAITVRSARAGDADDLARLSSHMRSRLALLSKRSGHEVFVAQEAEKVVGWLHVLCDMHLESGEFVEIAGLVVDENFRGRGAGTALVAAAEEWARLEGHASIRVRTNVLRREAHLFYERAGYALRKEQKIYVKAL
jgi:GNAT superfamily N-acetyltransferase